MYAVPQPSLTMSTKAPAVSKSCSMSRIPSPLSITCVSPSVRGLPGRAGRSRNPSWKPLEPGKDLLQSLLGLVLNGLVETLAVGVDSDGERAEVLDPELPEALGHQ